MERPDQFCHVGSSLPPFVLVDQDHKFSFQFAPALRKMQFLATVICVPDETMTNVDRAEMNVALEARMPLPDHRVVEIAWTLPRNMKLRNGESKWVLRQVRHKRLAWHVVDFGVPFAEWIRGPLRDWAENETRLKKQGLFAPSPIRECRAAHLSGIDWVHSLSTNLMIQA